MNRLGGMSKSLTNNFNALLQILKLHMKEELIKG